ncbi:methylated-DNA--[protein]-cysteine S-methyltransferase [Arthrobacter sp.]|uniref:methylated-DNA--[protein]-cysteine S-methyltransferase n=1 Tax=Arthrobacter sp. TaxID=1667 RepID=UPI0026E01327|nr:methylated-DNA--[protein]-cysteine S-methyltransferase [Arthrobacter sp.]MDO5751550.1 methylated-DNA--[protein]-cysteine S-methyltransferase [Arthrobacter sp.]
MDEQELPTELAPVAAADAEELNRLGAAFKRRASSEGLVDVAYRVIDSPVGRLLLAGTETGLVRVAFASEGHEAVLESLAATISPRVLAAPARLDAAAKELEEYFDRRRRHFDLALDFRLAHGFRREVLSHLQEIGYGHTASYAAVAALTTSPRAVRAVGTACARNPLPLVVPCHRVVRSDGSQGAYLGGMEAKSLLLALEAA